jgi:hypothetical protein
MPDGRGGAACRQPKGFHRFDNRLTESRNLPVKLADYWKMTRIVLKVAIVNSGSYTYYNLPRCGPHDCAGECVTCLYNSCHIQSGS